jgi:hypothetical protein
LADIINAAVMTGGPPHAGLAKGCMLEDGYGYDKLELQTIDLSYGYDKGGGPCETQDQSFTDRWNADSPDTGGGVYSFPKTRIAFVFVEGDPTPGPIHGKLYYDALKKAGTQYVTETVIPGTDHTIQSLPNGRAALEQQLEGGV